MGASEKCQRTLHRSGCTQGLITLLSSVFAAPPGAEAAARVELLQIALLKPIHFRIQTGKEKSWKSPLVLKELEKPRKGFPLQRVWYLLVGGVETLAALGAHWDGPIQ